jgi:hypothetical protein
MVFCGKPSESCHACRQRKTKCDKIPEGCTQCKRAKRGCPGYRVLGDLLFRDESTNVARKVKAKEAKKQGQAALPQRSGSELSEEEDPNLEATPKIVQQQDPHLSGLQLAPTASSSQTMLSAIPLPPSDSWNSLKKFPDSGTSIMDSSQA